MSAIAPKGATPAVALRLETPVVEALTEAAKKTSATELSAGDVIGAITKAGLLTTGELTAFAKAFNKEARSKRKEAMILGGAVIQTGDRVVINDSYYYKSMWGVTGTVEEVRDYYSGTASRRVWITVAVRLDHLPARRPKYAFDNDGLVRTSADMVDLLPAGM